MCMCFVAFVHANMKKGETVNFRLRGIVYFLLPVITLVSTAMLILLEEKHVILQSLGNQFTSNHDSSSVPLNNEVARESVDRQGILAWNMSISLYPAQSNSSNAHQNFYAAEGCNYGKGRWVADSRRPLYSGYRCKRWLSPMWACRLTRRTDFSYERYRWQPFDCELPEFDGTVLLERMQNKTIAFIGDSMGRQQFQSLMCMATGGGDKTTEVEDVGKDYNLIKHPGAIRPDGYAYRFIKNNTTILYYWSSCLAGLDPINKTDPETKIAMHLDKPPYFMSQNIHKFDVLVLNTGHHWNKGKFKANKWVIYVNGKPNEDQRLSRMGNAKNFKIHRIVNYVDSQMRIYPKLQAFFRTLSPRHFVNREWNTGGNCSSVPLTRGSEVLQDKSSDEVVSGAVNGTKVKILDITGLSKLRDEGHISCYSVKANEGINDCLHWCLPGIPDTWNELLLAQI